MTAKHRAIGRKMTSVVGIALGALFVMFLGSNAMAEILESKRTETTASTFPGRQTTILQQEKISSVQPALSQSSIAREEVKLSSEEVQFEPAQQQMIVDRVKTTRPLSEPVRIEKITTIEPGAGARVVEEVKTTYPATQPILVESLPTTTYSSSGLGD